MAGREKDFTTAFAPRSLASDLYARLADELLARLRLSNLGQASQAESW